MCYVFCLYGPLVYTVYTLSRKSNTQLYEMTSFEEIGVRAGTDKITHHGYQRFYPQCLDSLRDTATGILEIGIDKNHSVKLWKEYFTSAFVYGIDIGLEYDDERVKIMRADQSSFLDLENVRTQITHPIQFIIDDGSHIPEHQVLTFEYYFTHLLEPGGIYIIEDIETSYWTKLDCYGYRTEYGYKHPKSFIEYSKNLIDIVNKEFLSTDSKKAVHALFKHDTISSITFGQNCVIIKKKTMSEMSYNNRAYRFSDRL